MKIPARVATGIGAVVVALAVPIVNHFEGKVNKTYPDVVAGWKITTACYGHTGPELKPGMTFTDEECAELRNADLTHIYDDLTRCLPIATMPTYEQAAFLSLGFNGGAAMICNSSIPKKLEAGDHAAACATISDFYIASKKDCRVASNNCSGIVRRRAAERALCEGRS